MQTVTVKKGQSLFDISVRYTGKSHNALAIAALNGLNLTGSVAAGTVVEIPELQQADVDRNVIREFVEGNLHPGTAGSEYSGGIGNMGIEINFMVN